MAEQRWAKKIQSLNNLLAEKYQAVAKLRKLDIRIQKLLQQIPPDQIEDHPSLFPLQFKYIEAAQNNVGSEVVVGEFPSRRLCAYPGCRRHFQSPQPGKKYCCPESREAHRNPNKQARHRSRQKGGLQ